MESDYAEENLSTKQSPSGQKARISGKDGDKDRARSIEKAQGKGPQTVDRAALLRFTLPKSERLRKRADFVRVYENGLRVEGRFMTVFILPNGKCFHRLGVTATRKAIGKAHDRNRAKRLLREAYRLSREELGTMKHRFDWVLNARRRIIGQKLHAPLVEFRSIISRINSQEQQKE
jgi:ribonuclease P protein component